MAPEMIDSEKNNNKYSNEIDIWALGCIIYELCTLEQCFYSENIYELINNVKNCNYKDLENNDWKNIIKRLLNKNPDERFDINQVYNEIIKLEDNYKDLTFDEDLNSLDEFSQNKKKQFIS